MSISDESKHAPFDTSDDFDLSFKIFHELMAKRLDEILLVSSPYDAFILEEDGRLAERLIHEYRGLNLTRPPRLTWVPTPGQALDLLSKKKIDLVIIMPRLEDVDSLSLSREIKKMFYGFLLDTSDKETADAAINSLASEAEPLKAATEALIA